MKHEWNILLGDALDREQGIATQLEQRIVNLIDSGILNPGDRMPPIKELARELNISHSTVEKVYMNLIHKQVLISDGAHGTFVRISYQQSPVNAETVLAGTPPYTFKNLNADARTKGWRKLFWIDVRSDTLNLNEILNTELINMGKAMYAACSIERFKLEFEDTDLDNAIIGMLRRRGIYINTRQFCIASSQSQLVQYALRSLLRPGDVAVMSTIYDTVNYDLLTNCSARIRCAAADGEGMDTRILEEICKREKIKVVLVRPSADFPIPVALSKERRKELLRLAEAYNFVIVEVDEQYEFSYGNTQLPLIASTETNRVIYVSNISSTLRYQLARTIIIGSESFIKNLKKIAASRLDPHSAINDKILAKAIKENVIHTHVSRLHHQYSEHRKQLFQLAGQYLGDKADYQPPDSGRHLWVTFRRQVSSRRLHEIFHHNRLCIPHHESLRRSETYKNLRIAFDTLKRKEMEESFRQIAHLI